MYDRGGYLTRIEYGKRAGAETSAAPARVTFEMAWRCADQSCQAPGTPGESYPDVPWDLSCTSATACAANQTSPSFWSVYQLAKVTAGSLRPGSTSTWDPIETVDLLYSFPTTDDDPNDGYTDPTSPALWLRQLVRTGTRNVRTVPAQTVELTGTLLPNRVDYNLAQNVPKLNKYRLSAITTELGGQIAVSYGRPHPCTLPLPNPPGWDTNGKDCYPQPTRNGDDSGYGVFHKYQALQVEVDDGPGGGPNQLTRYTYEDPPAWHYDDSLLPGEQTWSDYRGHAVTWVETLTAGGITKSKTRHLTFRGMHGDKLLGGGSKQVSLADSEAQFTDEHYLAGYPLEERRYDGGALLEVDLHRYWAKQTVVGPVAFQQHAAQYVRENRTVGKVRNTAAATESWRRREITTGYEPTYGLPTSEADGGDTATTTDDTCTATTRTANTTAWLLDAPYRTERYAGGCTGGALIGRVETYYDDSTSLGAQPARGNPTGIRAYASATTATMTKTGYDGYGRVTSVLAPQEYAEAGDGGRKTMTVYTPATGLPTSVAVTNPAGHKVTTDYTQGLPARVTDANLNATSLTRDALGRITEVWRPGDVADGLPSVKYAYSVGKAAPSRVTTSRLLDSSRYVNTFVYVDGLGRTIETQAPSPSGSGRVVTAARYDDQGQLAAQSAPMFNSAPAGSGVLNPVPSAIPSEQRYSYDALGRPTIAALYHLGAGQWQTSTSYTGLSHTVDFPVRTDLSYHTDAFGRTSTIVERPRRADGTLDTATTSFRYTPAGQLDTITDDAGNVSDYDYDWLGRRTRAADPDQGTWSYGYDANGNPTTVTDARLATVWAKYDVLGRRVESRVGNSGGILLAAWTYDSAPGGVGLPASATRRAGGADYTTSVSGYDSRGRPLGKQTIIPAVHGTLAGTYLFEYGYDKADHLVGLGYPAVGDLPREAVTTTYSNQGVPATVTGDATYVASTSYFGDGTLAGRVLGDGRHQVHRLYRYDDPAGRLSEVESYRLDTANGTAYGIEETVYGYDPDGNLTSARDLAGGQTECFRYGDGLNRLTAAFTTGADCTAGHQAGAGTAPYNHSYSYDALGNLATANDPALRTFGYPTNGVRPHAVSSTSTGTTFGYDNNGAAAWRTAGGTTTSYTWDELPQLAEVRTGTNVTDMVYDAGGNRLLRTDPDGTTTLYLDGTEIRAAGSTVTGRRHYGDLALRVGGTGPDAGLWWTLANRQHSTSHTVNAATAEVRRQRYLPYGGRRDSTTGTLPTERGFLGKTEDPTGLVALGARYHDPTTGRFLSVDPILNLADPQSLNPYAYARNNPTSYTDPSGLTPRWIEDERGAPCTGQCAEEAEADEHAHATQRRRARETYKTGGISAFANQCIRYVELCSFVYHVGNGLYETIEPVGRALGVDKCLDLKTAGCAVQAGLFFLPVGKIAKGLRAGKAALLADDAGRAGASLIAHTGDDAAKALTGRVAAEAAAPGAAVVKYTYPPNRGFLGRPVRTTLKPGTVVDRYGADSGTFVSPQGTPFGQRSLPPSSLDKPLNTYEVVSPIEVNAGTVAAWFGQGGGGVQYEFGRPIAELIEAGILKAVGR